MNKGIGGTLTDDGEASETGGIMDAPDIRFETRGAAAIVTLDRPKALNALNQDMRAQFPSHLDDWASDPEIYCMIIRSANERAFCVGGDVRELHAQGRAGTAAAALEQEYKLNWRLDRFTKPTISLINGMVMGSGVGISQFGTHRIAGENYSFAMPEAAIGFFPDVGASWFLTHMNKKSDLNCKADCEIGTYLGLTGRSIDRADAFAFGLVSHSIAAEDFPVIIEAARNADPIDPVVDALHRDPGDGKLAKMSDVIQDCFSGQSVEEIIARVERVGDQDAEWRDDTLEALGKNSPLSLKVTLKQLRLGRGLDLRRGLQLEYRLAKRFLKGDDFYEGVRANLIDKDFKPAWSPSHLAEVSAGMVEDYFVTDGCGELALAAPSDGDVSND